MACYIGMDRLKSQMLLTAYMSANVHHAGLAAGAMTTCQMHAESPAAKECYTDMHAELLAIGLHIGTFFASDK